MAQTSDTEFGGRRYVLTTSQQKILDKIQEPDARSKQRKIGPSQIGGCPFCLAKSLALSVPEQYPNIVVNESESMAAWIGTGVHHWLEHNLGLGTPEQKVFVYELQNYGRITGSIDLELDGELFDFKIMGKYSLDKMRMAWAEEPNVIPSIPYRVQQMLYAYGKRQQGADITHVNLMVIPKMSNKFSDIRFYREAYNQEVVDKALARLDLIWEMVQNGDLMDVPAGDECYNCNNNWRIV